MDNFENNIQFITNELDNKYQDQCLNNDKSTLEITKIVVINNDVDWEFSNGFENSISDYLKEKFEEEFTTKNKSCYSMEFIEDEDENRINFVKETYSNPETFKLGLITLDKQKMRSVFKCVGYRFSQSSKFTKEIFEEFTIISKLLVNLYSTNNKLNRIKDIENVSIVCRSDLFYSLAKSIVIKEYKRKIHLKRYFYLAYMILGKIYIYNIHALINFIMFREYNSYDNFTWRNIWYWKINFISINSRTI